MAVRLVVRRAGAEGARGDGDVQYEFEQSRLVIGRSPSADLRLPALTVSDLHAALEQSERGYTLRDMRSTNGTRVNGTALVPDRPRALHDGDTLAVGEFTIAFETGGPVTGLTSPERTVSLAKRLLREGREHGSSPGPVLRWQVEGEAREPLELPRPPARLSLGSAPDADLPVQLEGAAGHMLELELGLDGVRVRPAEAQVQLNGKRVRERLLRDGDHLQCGPVELWLDDPTDRALRALEGQADAPLEATQQAPVPVAEPPRPAAARSEPTQTEAGSASASAGDHDEPADAPPVRRPSVGPDALVYTLAVVVLAASAVGMFWLLGE